MRSRFGATASPPNGAQIANRGSINGLAPQTKRANHAGADQEIVEVLATIGLVLTPIDVEYYHEGKSMETWRLVVERADP